MKGIFLFFTVLLLISVLAAEGKREKSKLRRRVCNRPCNKKLRPVCGSDGKTYNNVCLFSNAKCQANKTGSVLKIKSRGQCENSTVNISKVKKQSQKCLVALKDCNKVVNSTRHSVCGSNNITYLTFCNFRVARCQARQNGRNLTMLHKGECGKPKVKKSRMCPLESQCDSQNDPICGSDKKTYKNTCLFIVAKCQAKLNNKKLTMKKRGACGTRTSIKPCPKKCSSKERPVCGSDKKTYKNGCFLALAKCGLPKKVRGSLRLEYNGPCGAPATPKPCPRWEDCKIIDKPVCGTDGKTYPNVCRLRVAMCHARRNKHRPIKLRHRSACKTRKGKKEKGKKGKKNKKERSNRKGRKDRKD